MGKGDKPRFLQVPVEAVHKNWDLAFGKKKDCRKCGKWNDIKQECTRGTCDGWVESYGTVDTRNYVV